MLNTQVAESESELDIQTDEPEEAGERKLSTQYDTTPSAMRYF